MSNITFRRSIKQDMPEINNLFIEMIKTVNSRMEREGEVVEDTHVTGFEDGYLDRFYINDDRLIYVALDDDKIIGFISVINKEEFSGVYLDDYCVNENYRGQGVGSKLMQMAIDFAKGKGYDQVITHVQGANTESVGFYWKKGFKLVEKQDNVTKNRLLIRRVENHLPEDVQQGLFRRNNEIIEKILNKIKTDYPDSIDMVAIAGSFASGLFHEKSDLDLLIIANEDVEGLSKCFILDGIGYDIYYQKWDRLEKTADYNNMFVTKLKDLDIVYFRNEDVLKRYTDLQERLNANMNDEEGIKDKTRAFAKNMIMKKNSIQSLTSLAECYRLVGLLMNDVENMIYINNKDYSYGGTKNILAEMYYMSNKPWEAYVEYKRILDLTNIEEIKEWAKNVVKLLLDYYGIEDNDTEVYPLETSSDKKEITGENLIGTYEELYSNYYNKFVYALKTNNKYLSFRTMIDAQGFFDEFTSQFELPEFNLIEKYNPNDLKSNLDEFTKLLDEWKKLYDRFNLSVVEYDSIDELYSSNKRLA